MSWVTDYRYGIACRRSETIQSVQDIVDCPKCANMRSGLNLGVGTKGSTGGGTSSVVIVPETGSLFEKVIPKMVLVSRTFAVNGEAGIGRAFSGTWRFAVDRRDDAGRVTFVVRRLAAALRQGR
jgi:hypothetical protein